jgi:hypothetical protein
MADADWANPDNHLLGMLVHDESGSDARDPTSRRTAREDLLFLLNGGNRSRTFTLPVMPEPGRWRELLSTSHTGERLLRAAGTLVLAHALVLLEYGLD